MKLANPRIQSLKQLVALEEKRAAVQGQLDAIDQSISTLKHSVSTGSPVRAVIPNTFSPKAKPIGRPPGSKNTSKGGARKTHREVIMAALEAAGAAGVRVKDLAMAMKTKPVNIHSWFHSNLKRIPSIKKITGGHYRLGTGGKAPAPAPKAASKDAPAPKAGKRGKGTRRGALSARILDYLKSTGSGGVKIADVATRLGAKYKNIYIWFATTGKKHGVKRIAPATYKLA